MSANEEREDFLTEDPDVPGQKFVLLSFLSPEKVLSKKDHFFFEKFLGTYEFTFRVKTLEDFLLRSVKGINDTLNAEADKLDAQDLSGSAQIVRDSRIRMDTLMDGLQTFIKTNQSELKASTLKEQYEEFLYKNREKLEDDFYALNDFRTTVRGLKVRGVYSSKEEAAARSKKLQRIDTIHNIFVGEIGKWLPWDPAPSAIADHEYAEDQLNTLMKKYKENEEAREVFHKEQRERARKNKGVMNMDGNATESSEYNSSKNLTVSRTEETSEVPSLGTGASQFEGMFSGPADLAIQRKMAKE
jgi:hypothetical protein